MLKSRAVTLDNLMKYRIKNLKLKYFIMIILLIT